ncbi:hypothetical protein H6784_05075 [Candidatus Nomurabacteria bacterium]|nr:hypothetical protein [Candidatus Nomurabacteria bacterium]
MSYISPWLNVGCGEATPEGWVLGNLYYHSSIMDLLTRDEMTGYPHNGGEHSLCLNIEALGEDGIETFLSLVEERYQGSSEIVTERVRAFTDRVRSKLNDWKKASSEA